MMLVLLPPLVGIGRVPGGDLAFGYHGHGRLRQGP